MITDHYGFGHLLIGTVITVKGYEHLLINEHRFRTRYMCRRAESATSSTEASTSRRGRAARRPRSLRRGAAAVDRRAPYQWTLATRSRSAFIHDGIVNGARAGCPRSAVVAHVREKMARRRDGEGRRAKTIGRTSVVVACGDRADTCGQGGSPRVRASPRFRSCLPPLSPR